MTLAEQIKTARKDRNWTQSDLAMRCGVTLRTIQRIEKGEVTPSAYTLGKLVELLALEQDKSSQNLSLSVKTHSLKSKLIPLATLAFSKRNLSKLLLMLIALTLIFGSIFWGFAPTSPTLAEGKTDQITFSTVNCESTTSCDMQLTVRNLDGNIQLQKTYGGTSYDKANAVLPLSDGGYFLLGSTSSFGAGNYDILLIKVDASGKQLWQQTYGGFFNEYGEKISLSDGMLTIEGLQQKCTTANVSNDCYMEKWTLLVDGNGNFL